MTPGYTILTTICPGVRIWYDQDRGRIRSLMRGRFSFLVRSRVDAATSLPGTSPFPAGLVDVPGWPMSDRDESLAVRRDRLPHADAANPPGGACSYRRHRGPADRDAPEGRDGVLRGATPADRVLLSKLRDHEAREQGSWGVYRPPPELRVSKMGITCGMWRLTGLIACKRYSERQTKIK